MSTETDAGLEFFNRLSGRLEIQLTEEPQQATPRLANLVAPPTAAITSVALRMRVFVQPGFRELTEAEWARVVVAEPRIRMCDDRAPEMVVEHVAPDGVAFTVRDLAEANAETERRARGDVTWLGGIDVHHVFFEGIRLVDGVWAIHWGS